MSLEGYPNCAEEDSEASEEQESDEKTVRFIDLFQQNDTIFLSNIFDDSICWKCIKVGQAAKQRRRVR